MPPLVRFTLEVFGEVQVDRTLERFAGADVDLTNAWPRVTRLFLEAERRQFASEGRFGSGGWPALSPNYARWKRRHYPGRTILRRTDELFRSLTVGPQIRIANRRELRLGSAVAHGVYHQQGDGVPRRRPVDLPEATRRAMVKVIHEAIVKGGGR